MMKCISYILQSIKGAQKFVFVCLQSEWFILGLPSWGLTLGGTVSMYSTGIPTVQ